MLTDLPKITQKADALSQRLVDVHQNVIVLLPKAFKELKRLPYGQAIARAAERRDVKLGGEPLVIEFPNDKGTRAALVGLEQNISTFDLLTVARKLVAAHRSDRPRGIAVFCHGLDDVLAQRALEAVVAATLAANFALPEFKSKPDKRVSIQEIALCGSTKIDLTRAIAESRGNNLARYLTALPPNELTPSHYRRRVERLARQFRWKAEFWDLKKLRRLGAGAFVAVAQGSPEPDAGILRLRYSPRRKSSRGALALVGKGICFDTGGTNLKPARHMHGMHEDMEGSAVALGTLLALTELKVDFPVECWLALAQNHIGPNAYKQNDVVKAANGKTIEVMHTDAEGRMVLADTLYFASKQKPRLIIDYATLTGSCVAALSTRLSGAFTNRSDWISLLIKAGEDSGERVWPFPLPEDFKSALKSDIADIKQCTLDNDADHILAAMFLREFIEGDPAWIHIDLSAGNHKGGLAHIPTDVTGFGVRVSLDLVLREKMTGRGRLA
jgi:leucyl aminopeptidase